MSIYAPIRDAFSELNKLLIDKQQWDDTHELRRQDQALRQVQVEQGLIDQKMRRKLMEKEVREAEYAMEPVEVNIYDYLPNNAKTQEWLADPAYRSDLARVFDGIDLDRASGKIVRQDEQPSIMPRADRDRRIAGALGLIEGKMDPYVTIPENQSRLKSEMSVLEDQLKGLKDPRFVGERAPLEQKLMRLKVSYEQHEKMKSPENMLSLLQQRHEYQRQLMLKTAAGNGTKDLIDKLQANANFTQQQIVKLMDEIGSEKRWKAEMELGREKLGLEKERIGLEREKLKKDKDEKTQMFYAVATDGEGNVQDLTIPGNVVLGGVTKENTAKTPMQAFNDPRLKNHVWMSAAEMEASRNKQTERKTEWESVIKRVESRIDKTDTFGNITGTREPDYQDQIKVATKVAANIWAKRPDMENTEKVRLAETESRKILEHYWQTRKAIEDKGIEDKWTKDEIATTIKDWDRQFYEVYNFIPDMSKWEKIPSQKKESKSSTKEWTP